MSEDVQRMKEEARLRAESVKREQALAAKQAEAAKASAAAAAKIAAGEAEFEAQKGSQIAEQTAKSLEAQAYRIKSQAKLTLNTINAMNKQAEPEPVVTRQQIMEKGPKFSETMKNLQAKSTEFYNKAGFPTQAEISDYNKANKPATGYIAAGASPFKPKSTTEALNRLAYASTEMLIGGALEETFPFSIGSVPPTERESDTFYRVLGGVLTPSPADLVAGMVIARLAKTKTWLKITGKYGEVEISELEKATAREIEKLKGASGFSTAEIRAGVRTSYSNLEKIARFYKDHPGLTNAERSAAGSAQVPQVVVEFEDFLTDLGWDMDEYLDVVKSLTPDIPAGALVNILAASMDQGGAQDVIIDLADYTDRTDKYKFTAREKAALEEAAAELTEQPQDTTPIEDIPEDTDQPEDTEQENRQEAAQAVAQATVQETMLEEAAAEEEPPRDSGGRFIPRGKEAEDARRKMRGFGPKEKYRVRFAYHKGNSQTVTVEARGYIEAMNRAQRVRRSSRYLPKSATLERVQ